MMDKLLKLKGNRGFIIHFAVYIAVNIFLAVISLGSTPPEYWFVWPLAGWGAGILGHAACVMFSTTKPASAG